MGGAFEIRGFIRHLTTATASFLYFYMSHTKQCFDLYCLLVYQDTCPAHRLLSVSLSDLV